MATAIYLLLAITAASAVQVSYVAPVASGYIYRSDNGGPASLIQLGAQQYQQPAAFAPPLPIAQPLAQPLTEPEIYELPATPLTFHGEAQPLPYHIAEEDDDDDDNEEEEEEGPELYGDLIGLGYGHAHEKGGGSDYGEEHHAAHGEKGSKGYSSKDLHAEGESGHYGKEHKEGYYGEAEGEKGAHHDEADAHGKHHEAGSSYKGHGSVSISTMATAIYLLLAITAASAVQVSYVAPVASGYIYRSDNGGPASLIQLGAQQYQQPAAFAPPLPIAQPLAQPLTEPEIYELPATPLTFHGEAQPLPYHIAEEDDDDDDNEEEEEEGPELYGDLIGLGYGHAHEKGGGSDYGEEHHAAHGEKGSKGYSSKDLHAEGESGHYGKEHKEGYYGEAEGEKGAHHDEADAHGKHHEAGSSYKGANGGHKKHFSKGEDVTGYHKVFHKDEFKKDHDFYDVADNSGHFNKYGNAKSHHGSEAAGHKEGGHSDAAFDKGELAKGGFYAKGNHEEDNDSHSAEEGKESHYQHSEEHGKKGGGAHDKEYRFADDEDEDDDDDDLE